MLSNEGPAEDDIVWAFPISFFIQTNLFLLLILL